MATYGPALALFGLAFNGCNPALSVLWLTLALTIDGAMCAGYNVNAFDLSPNYAGTIRGCASTIANITGFLAPTIVSFIIGESVSIQKFLLSGNPAIKSKQSYLLDFSDQITQEFGCFQNTLDGWKLVFIVSAILYVITGTFFLIFGSFKTQKWNTYWQQNEK